MIKRNRIGELWLISFCSYLLLFCVGLDNDPEKIGIHIVEILAKFRNEGIVEQRTPGHR